MCVRRAAAALHQFPGAARLRTGWYHRSPADRAHLSVVADADLIGCSVFGKMGAWEKAVQVLTIMRSEVGLLAHSNASLCRPPTILPLCIASSYTAYSATHALTASQRCRRCSWCVAYPAGGLRKRCVCSTTWRCVIHS